MEVSLTNSPIPCQPRSSPAPYKTWFYFLEKERHKLPYIWNLW